jgi:hypothetical protein
VIPSFPLVPEAALTTFAEAVGAGYGESHRAVWIRNFILLLAVGVVGEYIGVYHLIRD